jgi:hypothetical protein
MPKYLVGWNLRGEQPDEKPKEFLNYSEAKNFLRDELRWQAEDEVDTELANQMFDVAMKLEQRIATAVEYGGRDTYRVGSFDYWIERTSLSTPSSFGGVGEIP